MIIEHKLKGNPNGYLPSRSTSGFLQCIYPLYVPDPSPKYGSAVNRRWRFPILMTAAKGGGGVIRALERKAKDIGREK